MRPRPEGPLSGLVALALVGFPVGCREGGRPAAAPAAHRYTVRAEVLRLPAPGDPRPEILLRHEAIDDFTDAEGRVVGMASMVMPFAVGPAVSLAGVSVGDKVEVRLLVNWAEPAFRVEGVARLPEGTELRLGRSP